MNASISNNSNNMMGLVLGEGSYDASIVKSLVMVYK
jgi:hypothetical protein